MLPKLLLAYISFPFIILEGYAVLVLQQLTEKELAEVPCCCWEKRFTCVCAEAEVCCVEAATVAVRMACAGLSLELSGAVGAEPS